MIKSVNLELSGGDFEFVSGNTFSLNSDTANHLIYEKNSVWHVMSDPCQGKYAKTLITLPKDYDFLDFSLKIKDGAVTLSNISCKNFYIDIKNAVAETFNINSEKLYISVAKGDLHITADTLYTNIDCGFGTIRAGFAKSDDGYSINSQHGNGSVLLNSISLPRKYNNDDGKRKIDIICGMGEVVVNTDYKF